MQTAVKWTINVPSCVHNILLDMQFMNVVFKIEKKQILLRVRLRIYHVTSFAHLSCFQNLRCSVLVVVRSLLLHMFSSRIFKRTG